MANHIDSSLRKIQKQAAISSAAKLAKIKPFTKTDEKFLRQNLRYSVINASNEIVDIVNRGILNIPDTQKKQTPNLLDCYCTSKIPQNCVYLFQSNFDNETSLCIIQEPPMKRTIQGEDLRGTEKKKAGKTFFRKHYNIQLPYVNYIISYKTVESKTIPILFGIGFSKKPFTSLRDDVIDNCLPHSSVHHVCMPSPQISSNDLAKDAKAYIESFWNSSFVYEFSSANSFSLKNQMIDSFEKWEREVKTPEDILSAYFHGDSQSFQDIINSRIARDDNSKGIQQFKIKITRNVLSKQKDIEDRIRANIDPLIQKSFQK
jgi:hypothetical protein